jgi:hypothetical protein
MIPLSTCVRLALYDIWLKLIDPSPMQFGCISCVIGYLNAGDHEMGK